LGRFRQIYLFVGMMFWVVLVLRGLCLAMQRNANKPLVFLVAIPTLFVRMGLLRF
jgi:hypothetical protein